MAFLTFSTVVNVCEDTNEDFDIATLLQQAGYTTPGDLTIQSLLVSDGQGGYVPAPTELFSQVDGDTVRVSAASIPNYFGSFDTLSLVFNTGIDTISLNLKVIIDPVNDAPSGADSTVNLTDGSAYVLKASDFGFSDIDGNNLKSVVFGAQPATGQVLLNGVAVTPGTEVSVSDIQAGLVTFQPAQGATGTVGLSFQVRDDGGLAGCNAGDLDLTPNVLSFNLPALASLACNPSARGTIPPPATVVVELYAGRLGTSSLVLEHRLRTLEDPHNCYGEGHCKLVWIDHASGTSVPVPEDLRQVMGA